MFVCLLVRRFISLFLLCGYACRSHVYMYVISSNHAASAVSVFVAASAACLYMCCMFLGNEISRNRSMH